MNTEGQIIIPSVIVEREKMTALDVEQDTYNCSYIPADLGRAMESIITDALASFSITQPAEIYPYLHWSNRARRLISNTAVDPRPTRKGESE